MSEAHQGQAAWAASGVLGILKDLGYVPQVDVLGDVVGEEVGEDVPLTLALPGLRLAAEDALIIPLTSVNHDVILEDAQGFVVQLILHPLDGPGRNAPLGGDSTGRVTIPDSVKDCQAFQIVQWFVLTGAGWLFTQSIQFTRYQRSVGTARLSDSGASLCHYCGLTARILSGSCRVYKIRYIDFSWQSKFFTCIVVFAE